MDLHFWASRFYLGAQSLHHMIDVSDFGFFVWGAQSLHHRMDVEDFGFSTWGLRASITASIMWLPLSSTVPITSIFEATFLLRLFFTVQTRSVVGAKSNNQSWGRRYRMEAVFDFFFVGYNFGTKNWGVEENRSPTRKEARCSFVLPSPPPSSLLPPPKPPPPCAFAEAPP